MGELHDTIRDFSDDDLRRAFFREKDQYTDEAVKIMSAELMKRGLTQEPEDVSAKEAVRDIRLTSEDFVKFDYSFSRTDLLLATAVLRDNAVTFFVDNPTSADIIPVENEYEKRYSLRVHRSFMDKAHELLDEHFVKTDGTYLSRYTGARDRLKAFNFNDIHMTEKVAAEELDVAFSDEESGIIIALANRLLREADKIEKEQERVLFYFDSIEPMLERLREHRRPSLSRSDLLAILEVLQVYADDRELPPLMDETINQLLTLFLEGRAP